MQDNERTSVSQDPRTTGPADDRTPRLPLARIEELASRRGVRRVAVENFLITAGPSGRDAALSNLELDARSYNWNAATVRAIRTGIMELFREAA